MKVITMCPKCGEIKTILVDDATPLKELDINTCDFCSTSRIILDEAVVDFKSRPHRITFEQQMCDKYLYNLTTFDQATYNARMNKQSETSQRLQKAIDESNNYTRNHPICPRCHSEAITTGNRGFSIWTGFIGSGQTVNRCGACGHSWKPSR